MCGSAASVSVPPPCEPCSVTGSPNSDQAHNKLNNLRCIEVIRKTICIIDDEVRYDHSNLSRLV